MTYDHTLRQWLPSLPVKNVEMKHCQTCAFRGITVNNEQKEQSSKATGHDPLEQINDPLARVGLDLL